MRAAGKIRRRGLWPRESRSPFVEHRQHPLGYPAVDYSAAGSGRQIWRFGGRVTGAPVSRSTVSSPSSAFHSVPLSLSLSLAHGEDNVRFLAPRDSGQHMPARDARGLRRDCAVRREYPSLVGIVGGFWALWECWCAVWKMLRLGFDEGRVGRVTIGRLVALASYPAGGCIKQICVRVFIQPAEFFSRRCRRSLSFVLIAISAINYKVSDAVPTNFYFAFCPLPLRDDETYKKIRLVLKTKYMVTNFSMRASLIYHSSPYIILT